MRGDHRLCRGDAAPATNAGVPAFVKPSQGVHHGTAGGD
jgi:hypothetical protein